MWIPVVTVMARLVSTISLFDKRNTQPLQDPGDSGMSKKDDELAHLHGKLEKQWGNNSDSSYAYIDHITGQCFPLTPFMMDEWVRGMVR